MEKVQLPIPKEAIKAFCVKWAVSEFALFGSVLREDFGPNSDVDVLLTFKPNTRWNLFDLADMKEELEELFGRKIDILTRQGIERSKNQIRKQAILQSAQVIHAA